MEHEELYTVYGRAGKPLWEIFQQSEVLDYFMGTSLCGMAKVSGDGEFLEVNEALCKIVKKSPGELIGSTFSEITPKIILAVDWANVQLLKDGGRREYILPKFYELDDGAYVFAVIHVVAGLKASGEFDKFYVIILPVEQAEYERLQEEIIGRVILPEGYSTLRRSKWPLSLMRFVSKYRKEVGGTLGALGFGLFIVIQSIAEEKGLTVSEFVSRLLR